MRPGRLSFDGMDRGTAEGKSSCRHEPRAVRSCVLLSALGILSLALWGALPALAQDSGGAAVIVNQDILSNLDWAAAAAAQARATAASTGKLLPPPESPPQSRLLVRPAPPAVAALPPGAPLPKTKPPLNPDDAEGAAPEAAPQTDQDDTGSGYATASEPAVIEPAAPESLPVVPPPPEPPAAPETSPGQTVLAVVPPPPEPEPAAPAAPPEPEPKAQDDNPAEDTAAGATQTAMVLPPKLEAGAFRLLFESGATALSDMAKGKLAGLAGQLRADPERRVQLQAFAGIAGISSRDARRLSLSRALAVRSFLIEKGVPAHRIDVRALGEDSGGGPPERVDVLDARG